MLSPKEAQRIVRWFGAYRKLERRYPLMESTSILKKLKALVKSECGCPLPKHKRISIDTGQIILCESCGQTFPTEIKFQIKDD